MTESALRRKAVDAMRGWLGAVPGSTKHADILRTYNSHRPLARSYAIQPGDAYCAATVSAAWIRAGVAAIAPLEVSVPKMAELAQKRGIWVEDDGFTPRPGDAVVYDWQDDGKGDNRGRPDHVGLVESVSGGAISVLEGNMGAGHMVGRRALAVDGRYIRGYIRPDYKSLADAAPSLPLEGKVAAQQPDEGVSLTAIAREVIAGKWGNGADRKRRLTAAGHDYKAVQAEVNRLLKGSAPSLPLEGKVSPQGADEVSLTAIAREVIAGKWGNGADRRRRLTAAGHDYKAVQTEVNRLLKG